MADKQTILVEDLLSLMDDLREEASDMRNEDLGNLLTKEYVSGIRYAANRMSELVTPTSRPTMAETEWSDDEHHLAEAEHVSGYTIVMVAPDSETADGIDCIVDGERESIIDRFLTPTGRRFRLVPEDDRLTMEGMWVEPDHGPEKDLEDLADHLERAEGDDGMVVSPDPQPGEAWLIEVRGIEYPALRTFSDAGCEWLAHDASGQFLYDTSETTPIRRLVTGDGA